MDLDDFYKEAAEQGYVNNSNRKIMIDAFNNEEWFWIKRVYRTSEFGCSWGSARAMSGSGRKNTHTHASRKHNTHTHQPFFKSQVVDPFWGSGWLWIDLYLTQHTRTHHRHVKDNLPEPLNASTVWRTCTCMARTQQPKTSCNWLLNTSLS